MNFRAFADTCNNRREVALERRSGNALNVEIGQAQNRCVLMLPDNWGESAPSALRWLASGGSPRRACPLLQ